MKYPIYSIYYQLVIVAITRTSTADPCLVQYYTELVTNRTEQALKFELPTDARMYEAEDKNLQEYGIFDFIIIGAGSTGCVVANRLSENSEWKVLVLEAGSYGNEDLTGIPSIWIVDVFTKFNWGFYSVKQRTGCLGNKGRKCVVTQGKGVGGTSLINGMVYTRGNRRDYDRWSYYVNCSGWNYRNVLPYFKKSESFTVNRPDVPTDLRYHGFNGPLQMTRSIPPQIISTNILRGSEQLGYSITDYNGKHQMGASVFQIYARNGRRVDQEMAYIAPARNRQNLKILDESYVTKIKINSLTKQVEGVIFTRANKTYIARQNKEVILSAGGISSPKILMLSGVGPKDHLQSHGIPVIRNLPVGRHMRDHTLTSLIFSTNITSVDSTEKAAEDFLGGRGQFTRPVTFDGMGFFKTEKKKGNYPNFEILFNNFPKSRTGKRFFGWSNELFNALDARVPNPITISLLHLDVKSKGTVKLKSANAFDYPLINPNILSDKDNRDMDSLYEAVQLTMKLIETEAFRSMNTTLAVKRIPGCDHTESLSKEYWLCYIRRVTTLGLHQVGSCRMGRNGDTGVVDRNLKVFGVGGLRIADASIIPLALSGHTNAACTMVGEKAADMIKQDHVNNN